MLYMWDFLTGLCVSVPVSQPIHWWNKKTTYLDLPEMYLTSIRLQGRLLCIHGWVHFLRFFIFTLLQALATEKDEKRRHASFKAAVESLLGKEWASSTFPLSSLPLCNVNGFLLCCWPLSQIWLWHRANLGAQPLTAVTCLRKAKKRRDKDSRTLERDRAMSGRGNGLLWDSHSGWEIMNDDPYSPK